MADSPDSDDTAASRIRPRLLLMGQDQAFIRLLATVLAAEGFYVDVALEGFAGPERVREEPWDLVVLDVMLSRVDHFEILRELRSFSSRPVLMLTGQRAENDLICALGNGADDYVAKTCSVRELSVRIRTLLSRA